MAESCAIIPRVLNKDNQKVDSKLYMSLLSFTGNNRLETNQLYLITKSKEFIDKFHSTLKFDENGEPTLSSLLQKTNFNQIVDDVKVRERLNREIGYYKQGADRPALWLYNNTNFQKLTKKAIAFNRNSEFRDTYVARVIKIDDKESHRIFLGVKVERRNKLYSIEADKMEYNDNLNTRLREILAEKGVTTGALTELEERMGINGVTDFDTAKKSAEGLLEMIRLANGIEGEKALPEEFAHFALEALGDSPLVNRLVNLLHSNGLVNEILGEEYETYYDLYKGDTAKLAKEAAGKLLAKHLLKAEPIEPKPYKNLLERIISAIKSFFRNMNASQIQRAMYEADKKFGALATDILSGSMNNKMSLDNIKSSGLFYQTNERVERDRKLLKQIRDNESKRLKIYEQRNPKSKFSSNQRLLIDRLELELATNNEIEGIYVFAQNALEELGKLKTRLRTIQSTPTTDVNEKASVLRDIRNYLKSYTSITKDIRQVLIEEEKYEDNRYGQRIRVVLDNITVLLDDLYSEYKEISMPLFINYMKPFLGDSVTVQLGKYKGQTFKAEELLTIAMEDISFFDRWLDSMADSSSPILRVFDQAYKQKKENSRLATIQVEKELQAATLKLEKAGIKNTDWMFERDSKGNLTGNYISDINWALYKEKVAEMFKTLNQKYGRNPLGQDAENYKKERKAWFEENLELVDGKRVPKKSLYGSKEFAKLNTAQREYYNKIMEIKASLDALLPENATRLLNTVKIRKDLLERLKSSSDVKEGVKQVWEAIKDSYMRRTDDIELGEKNTIKDFEDREVQFLPIFYTTLREGESNNDISTDIVSTLTAYAAMANDFNELSKIIDILELGRDMLRDNLEVMKTRGEKPLVEKFKIMGRTIENKVTKGGEERRIISRLDDFFKMQVYGRYMDDEGTFGNTRVDKAKAANLVNSMTAINTLAVNILSGISNVMTGSIMMRIESFSGEFFNPSNVMRADREYGKALPEFMAEIGNRVKVSKLALWNELFDTMQEFDKNIKDLNFDRKTWFSRMFSTNTLFFMSNAGEHWMQTRTSLALADTYKMKAPNGKIVSLWDAMEVVPIDGKNKKLGAKLQVKQGYTKADGTTFTQDDIIAFSRKVTALNQRMHGIYNKADRNAFQRLAVGRMALMFRRWIKPNLNRRFKSASYNMDLQAWTEGYYRTTFRFFAQMVKDLRQARFDIATQWNNLNKTEKANIRRAFTELAHYLATVLVLGLIDWDDSKDRPWIVKMTEYQLRRLKTEVGVLIPGKPMLDEGLKILKSPTASIQTVQSLLDTIGLLNPWNYEAVGGEDAIIQSGQFKGKSEAYRLFMKSPANLIRNTVTRGIDPELVIPFYKQ